MVCGNHLSVLHRFQDISMSLARSQESYCSECVWDTTCQQHWRTQAATGWSPEWSAVPAASSTLPPTSEECVHRRVLFSQYFEHLLQTVALLKQTVNLTIDTAFVCLTAEARGGNTKQLLVAYFQVTCMPRIITRNSSEDEIANLTPFAFLYYRLVSWLTWDGHT